MTLRAVLHTVAHMNESWQVAYLRHVQEVVERQGGSLSAVAKAAGIASTTLTRPLNNPQHKFTVKLATLEAVQRQTGIPFAPFAQGQAVEPHDADDETEQPMVLVPVYDVQASAGAGLIPPEHEAVAYRLELPSDYLASLTSTSPERLQVISVKGTSMLPTLKPGDLVMVDPVKNSLTYDGLFVLNIDGAVLVKRIGRGSKSGTVSIISDSREQPPVERPIKEIHVIGKVIWRGVKE